MLLLFMITLWIDNDGCPKIVREMVLKTSARLQIPVKIVGNSFWSHPANPLITMICVPQTFDAADDYIYENIRKNDLVISSDVPLASKVVSKGAIAISTHGEIFNAQNVAEKLATRNLSHEFRGSMPQKSGTFTYNEDHKKKFAAALDKMTILLIRESE